MFDGEDDDWLLGNFETALDEIIQWPTWILTRKELVSIFDASSFRF